MPVKPRSVKTYYPYLSDRDSSGTVKELKKAVVSNIGTISASGNKHLFIAPDQMKITAIKLLVDTTIAAHDTNYWSFQVVSFQQADRSQAPNLLSSVSTTKITGGSAITGDTPFTLTPDQNIRLNSGDTIELQMTKAASASNLSNLVVQVDYEAISIQVATTTSTTTTTSTSTSTSTTTTTT